MAHTTTPDIERQFFDRVASRTVVNRMPNAVLERYARPKRPELFSKEKMFSLLGRAKGKRVLEIGCGEGEAAVQLAYAGARVTGLDVSPMSIEVARQRAALQEVSLDLHVGDATSCDLGEEVYDVVWCDLILHHLVPALDDVLPRLRRALKPGGLFVARDPIVYAGWLRWLRKSCFPAAEATPDEQPFRDQELETIRRHFPTLQSRCYGLTSRIDQLTSNLSLVAWAARLDNALFLLPGTGRLASCIVLWAYKEGR